MVTKITEVKNETDMRSAVILMNAAATSMCNAKTIEDLNEKMFDAKDTLLALYRYLATKFGTGDN